MSDMTKSASFDYTEVSTAAPPPYGHAMANAGLSIFQSRFASITRHGRDRIRLANLSEVEIADVHQIVRTFWPRGIDKVYLQKASREFKLGGYAWRYDPNGNEQAMLLTLRILEGMHGLGWVICSPTEVTKSLSTNDLVNDIIATFMIDIQRHDVTPDRAKIKFKGRPWRPRESNGAETLLKLLALLETFERHGFTLYTKTSARFTNDGKVSIGPSLT
ncbi:hypothetical protein FPRO04_10843 [Fusarium proliferatum]|nr:hypothetical protein FPRO04_10843 [Fusarium proliferatum]